MGGSPPGKFLILPSKRCLDLFADAWFSHSFHSYAIGAP
jgi:hypothetical protein